MDEKLPAVLEIHIAELENSISHLRQSNEEIKSFLDETPDDKDFIGVIDENNEVITRKNKQLKELQKTLADARSQHQNSVSSTTSATPASVPSTSSSASTSESSMSEEMGDENGFFL